MVSVTLRLVWCFMAMPFITDSEPLVLLSMPTSSALSSMLL